MLFTSPVFLFMFLPFMMLSYICVPQRHRKSAILIYNILYYTLANFRLPVNILLMAAVILLTYVAGEILKKNNRYRIVALFCSLLLFTLFLIRTLAAILYRIDYDYYPLGASVYILSAISYINDVYRKDAPAADFLSLVSYITFFPILICGPFIKYKDFIKLTDKNELRPSLDNFAAGIPIFALGFIKRIGIAAVLVETHEKLFLIGENGFSIILLLIISVLTFLSVYFAFTGYSDMATGLCRMLGIKTDGDMCGFFSMITSPRRYLSGFLPSLGEWMDDYVKQPVQKTLLEKAPHKEKRTQFIASFMWAMCLGLWFKAELKIILILIPVAIVTGIEETFIHKRKRMRSFVYYIFSAAFNFIFISFFWSFIKNGGFDSFFSTLTASSIIGHEEQLYEMLSSLFSVKTFLSFGAAVICILFTSPIIRKRVRGAKTRGAVLIKGICVFAVLAMFFACILLYMPQYPIYATIPFKHFAI